MSHRIILMFVMAVPLLVWFGVFFYLLMIDRSLRQAEQEEEGNDSL